MSPRISAAMSAAQFARVRETGLKVTLLEDRANKWEYVAGTTIAASFFDDGGTDASDPLYWQYRGFAGMNVMGDGDIYRVRLGNLGDVTDRRIWDQNITDPSIVSQWTTWSVLYSGTHVGTVTVMPNGNTPVVYHAKSGGGVYRNNILQWTPGVGAAMGFIPISNVLDAGWVIVLRGDNFDSFPTWDLYYTPDLTSVTPVLDQSNYRWRNRPALVAWQLANTKIARIQSGQLYHDSRVLDRGTALWYQEQDSVTDIDLSPPRVLRGIGGGAGLNRFTSLGLLQATDGYYYLHAGESFKQVVAGVEDYAVNLGLLRTWSRSTDLKHWTESSVGPGAQDSNGFAGVVELGNYVYWGDNGQVWRRPAASGQTSLENYIDSLSIELPRDNQTGSGEATVANPAGINDNLLNLSDQELKIEIGLKNTLGSYEFVEFSRFFLRRCLRQISGAANRIRMPFGDLWARLEVPLKDTTNFIGKTDWSDWNTGKRNESFNYYFAHDTAPVQTTDLNTTGDVLWTGWRGHNPDFSVRFVSYSGNPGIFARYVDSHNFIKVLASGSTLKLYEVIDDVSTLVASSGITPATPVIIRIVLKWNKYWVYYDGVLELSGSRDWGNTKPGYVGFSRTSPTRYTIDSVEFSDWEYDLQLSDMIRAALALGDFHNPTVTGADEKAYALVWGPSTDLATAADALRQLLVSLKLQLAYQGGSIIVNKFDSTTVLTTLQDTIIDSEEESQEQKRINYAIVDGNEFFWIEVDVDNLAARGRQIVSIFDLPELLDLAGVQARAAEEIANSNTGSSPTGTSILLFDLWRMDYITWIDNLGNSKNVRVEGLSIQVSQGKQPSQRMKIDTAVLPVGA